MSKAVYITSKIDGVSYCKTNGQFTRHLRSNNLTYQEYYETYISKISPKCSCGEPLTFYQKSESYANSCGNPTCVGINVSKTKQLWTDSQRLADANNKKAAANLRTPEEIAARTAKSKATFKQKYGVEWATQSIEFKDKSRKTKLDRYGNEYYANSSKTSKSWQAMPTEKINQIVEKRRLTCLERFGVENALMKPEARVNSAKANSLGRKFVLPSGRIIGIRGYEDIVLSKLLETYSELDLQVDDRLSKYQLPVFDYIDHRRHHLKYYPDIYILKENKLIEVKSRWWWDGNGLDRYKSRLKNNLRKKDAVLQAGYEYEVWLFESRLEYKVLQWKK